jgi:glyoxylase-like metal-dependent hydrolase (beta-lactamase superfamily II)
MLTATTILIAVFILSINVITIVYFLKPFYFELLILYLKSIFSFIIHQIHSHHTSTIGEILQSIFKKEIKNLPTVDIYEQCSPRTYRILGLNPGPYTLQGTNTWLITSGSTSGSIHSDHSDHVLIDTGEERTADKYVPYLLDHVFPLTKTRRLSKILLTHGHKDHQGGVQALLEGLKARGMLPLPTIHKRNVIGGGKYPNKGFKSIHIEDKEVFQVGGGDDITTLEAIYLPGHTDDSIGFILHEDSAFISGDCILGCGTVVFDNLSDYMNSLKIIHKIIITNNNLCGDCNTMISNRIHTIYPGHGPVIKDSAIAKVEEYITHREGREKEIYHTLKQYYHKVIGSSSSSSISSSSSNNNNSRSSSSSGRSFRGYLTSFEIVTQIYGPLHIVMRASAQNGVIQHLNKLRNDGKVEFMLPDLWRIKL